MIPANSFLALATLKCASESTDEKLRDGLQINGDFSLRRRNPLDGVTVGPRRVIAAGRSMRHEVAIPGGPVAPGNMTTVSV